MGNISSNTDERKRLSVEATGDRGDDRGTDSGNNLALLLDVLGVGEEEADSINNAPLGVNEFTDLLLSCGARDSLTLDRTRRLATNKFAEAEESTVGLIDLFDEVIADIAHYLLPPDVYSLCLTSKRFHRPTTLPTSPEYLELGGNAPGALLSTRLLRISLLDSLERVLRMSKTELTPSQVLSFSKMASSLSSSVVISGSTMVQVVLGEQWENSDIDIFCTPEAAPAVRSWLVDEAGQILAGVPGSYIGGEGETIGFMSKLHHVENYANAPEGINYDRSKQINELLLRDSDGEDYQNPPYRIETLTGDSLPYRGQTKGIDLVVTKAAQPSAMVALDDFDINICKCAWNGNSFSIPYPHLTFARRSTLSNVNKDLIVSYRKHYVMSENLNSTDVNRHARREERLNKIRLALESVQGDGVLLPAPLLPAGNNRNEGRQSRMRDVELHNYIVRQFERLKKYAARGIAVEDLPSGALEFQIYSVHRNGGADTTAALHAILAANLRQTASDAAFMAEHGENAEDAAEDNEEP